MELGHFIHIIEGALRKAYRKRRFLYNPQIKRTERPVWIYIMQVNRHTDYCVISKEARAKAKSKTEKQSRKIWTNTINSQRNQSFYMDGMNATSFGKMFGLGTQHLGVLKEVDRQLTQL